jgi:glycosyltransferase involved in cell wall biosynthesis
MKILQLIQKPQRRGAEIFTVQLSEELMVLGHEVILVALFKHPQEIDFSGSFFLLDRPLFRRFFDGKGWLQLSRLIRDFQPEVVQANAADTLKFAVFSQLIFGWKSKLVYRNANQMGDFIRGFWHKKFNQFLVDRVAGVISVSQASQIDFLKTFRYSRENCRTVPIGIVPKEIENKLKEVKELPPNPYLIQIGSLVPEKDPFGMLEIFEGFVRDFPDLQLMYLGSGPLEEELLALINRKGLGEKVGIIPNRANPFPILGRASALVMPSKIEGLPGVVLEAMYCRVPVVAYNVGGIREVLQSGKNGWLVQAGDREGFEAALNECLKLDESELWKITESAKKTVEQRYDLSKVAEDFVLFYNGLTQCLKE